VNEEYGNDCVRAEPT